MATQHVGGRGGAGNIKQSNQPREAVEADDLKTPTIKQTIYTTGRGGMSAFRASRIPTSNIHTNQ